MAGLVGFLQRSEKKCWYTHGPENNISEEFMRFTCALFQHVTYLKSLRGLIFQLIPESAKSHLDS